MKNTAIRIMPAALLLAASLSAQALTPPPPLTPGSGKWVKESATYGTPNLRDAYVYVPANANPQVLKHKRALMLTLHQCGGSATGVMNTFKWEATAEKYGMVVVAPTSPSRFLNGGCWDMLGTDHSAFNRDAGPLKKLIDSVKARTNLDIDPEQVYVTGFSSGAGEAHLLSCMAPSLFSAVGLVHAPALGMTSGYGAIPSPETIAANCKKYSGNADTSKQIMSITFGGKDTLTTPAMARANIDGMKLVYGIKEQRTTTALPSSSTMKEFADTNGRVRFAEIEIPGIAHTWPTASNSIDYPAIFTDWVFKNRAIVVNTPPTLELNVGWVDSLQASNTVNVSFRALDGDGIASAFLEYQAIGEPVMPVVRQELSLQEATVGMSKQYQVDSGRQYRFRFVATDKGQPQLTSELVKATQPLPYPFPGQPGKPVSCGVTSTSVCLQWAAASNAQYYIVNVVDSNREGLSTTATTLTVTGLTPDTAYTFSVMPFARYPGAPANSDPIKTLPYCKNYSDTLKNHVSAGRAYTEGPATYLSRQKVYANGSKDYLGEICNGCIQLAVVVNVPVAETKPAYFIKGTCQAQ